jgi:aminoglycoside phosphotransferase (APT) family kinase protein
VDADGWFLRGTRRQWQRLERATVEILADLHAIEDGPELGFLRPDAPGETALGTQLAYQSRYYDWAREGRRIALLEEAIAALERTLPSTRASVLNWGDSRPGNIIYRDFEPVAVLDWEMATVGPPEVDVAWLTFFQRFFAHLADRFGLPPVPAMFVPAEVAATYQRRSGRSLGDLAWFEAFAGLRFGIILARMSLRNIAFGIQEPPTDNNDLVMFAPLLEKLLSTL